MEPIVIVGGGYAGLTAALELRRSGLPVLLVDREENFTHSIRLHKTIYRSLNSYQTPFQKISSAYKFDFLQASVDLNPDTVEEAAQSGRIGIGTQRIAFSQLVLAPGAGPAFTVPQAYDIGRIRRTDFSQDVRTLLQKEGTIRIAVVGAGATGLQFVFEWADFLSGMRRSCELYLIEKGERLLPSYPDSFQGYVVGRLQDKGIQLLSGTTLDKYAPQTQGGEVLLSRPGASEPDRITADLLMVLGGVRPQLELKTNALGQCLNQAGEALPSVYAAGDAARFPVGMDTFYAQAAVRKAKLIAENIKAAQNGKDLAGYNYEPLGTFISLGFWDGIGWLFKENRMVTGLPAFALKESIENQFKLYLAGLDTYLKLD